MYKQVLSNMKRGKFVVYGSGEGVKEGNQLKLYQNRGLDEGGVAGT